MVSVTYESILCYTSIEKQLITLTGVKDFKCDMHGRLFAESGSLKTHMKWHLGARPHQSSVQYLPKAIYKEVNMRIPLKYPFEKESNLQ